MIVIMIPRGSGLGSVDVLRLPVDQVVVTQDNGTPILVAAEHGPERAQLCSKVGDADFADCMRRLGLPTQVTVEDIELPGPPQGARLVRGPRRS
jgi:hypothetical protein